MNIKLNFQSDLVLTRKKMQCKEGGDEYPFLNVKIFVLYAKECLKCLGKSIRFPRALTFEAQRAEKVLFCKAQRAEKVLFCKAQRAEKVLFCKAQRAKKVSFCKARVP
jgi:hypothetical protein